MLTPLEIHEKEFSKSFRGYNENEVDEFLDQVVRDFEDLLKENSVLKEQLRSTNDELERYKGLEATLRNALVIAQGTAEELKANAHKEAAMIVERARADADRIVREAEEKAAKVAERIRELERERDLFMVRMKGLVQAYLDLLDRGMKETPFSDGVTEVAAGRSDG
ncbi:MAG TPA: DivIVA domain-containing protein [Clostridia bacterium]|nr:DivIVA domain-containing protein [Clostridia bacterium]